MDFLIDERIKYAISKSDTELATKETALGKGILASRFSFFTIVLTIERASEVQF